MQEKVRTKGKSGLTSRLRALDSLYFTSQVANQLNEALRQGTAISFHDMDLFVAKGERLGKVGYEQAKGNLFEYIEAAKLERNNVNAGYAPYDRFVATDAPASAGGYGEHTAPDDFRLVRDGEYLGSAQAKVNNNPHDTAVNFENPKYEGMQRVTTSDNYAQVREQVDAQLDKGEISQAQHDETLAHMRAGLTDEQTGISSGGTTNEELQRFRSKDGKVDVEQVRAYANEFKLEQAADQIIGGALQGATCAAIVGGTIYGVQQFLQVYKGEEDLDEALAKVAKGTATMAARGALVNGTAETLNVAGQVYSISALQNSTCLTAMAAGMVEGGACLLAYAKGEIDGAQLQTELTSTAVKSTGTYFVTNQVSSILASGGLALPMVAYSVGASMLMSTYAIIKQAQLRTEEYQRLAELAREETRQLEIYRQQLQQEFQKFRADRQEVMQSFLQYFDKAAFEKADYSGALNALLLLSQQCNFSLQHQEFAAFQQAMLSDDPFVLD